MWKAERLLSADGQPTRWLAEEGGFFVMHLGCQKIVKGFRIDNSQHKNKEGNKKDSFAFEILSQLSVFVFLDPSPIIALSCPSVIESVLALVKFGSNCWICQSC